MSLSPAQIKHFQQDLEARYLQLREEIAEELKHTQEETFVELAGRVRDPAEASVADLLQGLEIANIDRHSQEAKAIDRALVAIQRGDYGECTDCGRSINVERLEVAPWAERCIDCQEKREREYHVEGSNGRSI